MRFDPFLDEPLVEVYEELALRKEFHEWDGLLRIAILHVSDDSPLARIRDFEKRLEASIERLGFQDEEQLIIHARDKSSIWNRIVFLLFQIINDIDYEDWWTTKTSLSIIMDDLRQPGMKEIDRVRLGKEIDSLKTRIRSLEYNLFKEDHIKQLVNRQAVEQSLQGYAERYALDPPQYNK